MLKIIENLDNNELISPELSQKIADMIIDKDYDYSIGESHYIPNVNHHTSNILEPTKSNMFLNKNTFVSCFELDI